MSEWSRFICCAWDTHCEINVFPWGGQPFQRWFTNRRVPGPKPRLDKHLPLGVMRGMLGEDTCLNNKRYNNNNNNR